MEPPGMFQNKPMEDHRTWWKVVERCRTLRKVMEPSRTGKECCGKMWKDMEPSGIWNGKRWKEKEL